MQSNNNSGQYIKTLIQLSSTSPDNVFECVQHPQFLQLHLFDIDLEDIPRCWDNQWYASYYTIE